MTRREADSCEAEHHAARRPLPLGRPRAGQRAGLPPGYVWRILRKNNIQPARLRSWCISTDPDFAAKAADIIGLHLNPPGNAVVICVDEKPSIQALSRRAGYVETSDKAVVRAVNSTYQRNGTVKLFAALEISTGLIHSEITHRKRRRNFLEFMGRLLSELHVDPGTRIHVIMDNSCIHKRCDDWLSRHPNVVFHYTPTSASWLNMVEIWFNIMSRKVLRGAGFDSPPTKSAEPFISSSRLMISPANTILSCGTSAM